MYSFLHIPDKSHSIFLKKKLIFIIMYVLSSPFVNSQWHEQQSNTSAILHHVHFININSGIVVGLGGVIISTSDGGINWIARNSGLNVDLSWCLLLDQHTGFVCGDKYILKTTDGGITWNSFVVMGLENINSIVFYNSTTGLALGSENCIYRTTNTGITWNRIHSEPSGKGSFGYAVLVNDTLIICSGARSESHESSHGTIDIFSNDGEDYVEYEMGGPGDWIGRVSFAGNHIGYFNMRGGTYKSTNGGIGWNMLSQYIPGEMAFYNDSKGILFDGYNFKYTDDAGLNWHNEDTVLQYYVFNDMQMVSSTVGVAVGYDGKILRNDNVIGITQISSITPKEYKLEQNYPNPFNPITKIRFEAPLNKRGFRGLSVQLIIYNSLGKEIQTLVNQSLQPGEYSVNWNAADFPSGIYFYKLTVQQSALFERSDGYSETKKMVLIK